MKTTVPQILEMVEKAKTQKIKLKFYRNIIRPACVAV